MTAISYDLKFLGPIALQAELEHLLPLFAQQAGVKIEAEYDLNPVVPKRVLEGEAFDVGMSNPWFFDELVSAGRVDPDVHVPFGRVPLAVGTFGPMPDRLEDTHEGVARLLSQAESIAYTSEGTSGKAFLRALEMLGLKDQITERLRPMGSYDPPMAAARREVQYAVNPFTRIIAVAGISPIATFPADLGLSIEMSMFVRKGDRHNAALQLIEYLSDSVRNPYLLSHNVSRYELQKKDA